MITIVHLEEGQQVERFKISSKLGEGSFGAVYKVESDGKEYALKTEHINVKMQVLKIELFVMRTMTERKSRHLPELVSQGTHDNFNYIVMKLLGHSMQDVKKLGSQGHLSLGSAIGAAIQCLRALEELHWAGFLHRDVKPGNFAIGCVENGEQRRIFALDFGMCRRFVNNDNVILPPRNKVSFRGTPRYAPLASHNLKEHGRREDVESWFYMLVDFTNANLPWKPVNEIKLVGEKKKDARSGELLEEMFKECPREEYHSILKEIDQLEYADEPNYESIYKTLYKAMRSRNVKEIPYDWEDKI